MSRLLRFEEVAFFAVLAEIETLLLDIGVNAHADQGVADLEDNECTRRRKNNGGQNANAA